MASRDSIDPKHIWIIILPAVVTPAITYWLFHEWLSSPFFLLFEALLIVALGFILLSPSARFRPDFRGLRNVRDFVIIASSVTVFAANWVNLPSNIIMPLSILVVAIFPGYALLLITGWAKRFSCLEQLLLSFVLSVPITAVLVIIDQFLLPAGMGTIFMTSVYLTLPLVAISRERFSRRLIPESEGSGIELSDLIALVLTLGFFIVITANLYPYFGMYPGEDVVRHFSTTKLMNYAPDLLQGVYPWFHYQWYAVYNMAGNPDLATFSTFIPYLSGFVILAFFIMARSYLHDIDHRLPALSTILFVFFIGLSWVIPLGQDAPATLAERYTVLHQSFDKSYWALMYGASSEMWLWYRPVTITTIMFLTLLFLFKKEKLSSACFISLFALTMLTLGMTHPPELIIFIAIFPLLALFWPERGWRYPLIATVLGLVAVGGIRAFNYWVLGYTDITIVLSTGIPLVILLGTAGLSKLNLKPLFRWIQQRSRGLMVVIITAYIALGIAWNFAYPTFSTIFVHANWHSVPWVYYPHLLGIVGLLGLIALSRHPWRQHPDLKVFLMLLIAAFIIGQVLELVNLHLLWVRYGERRLFFSMLIPLCIFASLTLLELQRLRHVNWKSTITRIFAITALISVITFLGFSTYPILFEHNNYMAKKLHVSDDALTMADELDRLLKDNPRVAIYTLDTKSRLEAEFSFAPWMMYALQDIFWTTHDPEAALRMFRSDDYELPYVFLRPRDLELLKQDKYARSYIRNHIQYFPPLVKKPEGEIYKILSGPPPSLTQGPALLRSSIASDRSWMEIADLISLAGFTYTVYIEGDPALAHKNDFIITGDADELDKLPSSSKVLWVNVDGNAWPEVTLLENSIPLVFEDVSPEGNGLISLPVYTRYSHRAEVAIGVRTARVQVRTAEPDEATIIATGAAGEPWQAEVWDEGEISIPRLSSDSTIKYEGSSSLRIEVGEGKNAQWNIKLPLNTSNDWASFDYLSFYWLGQNTGKDLLFEVPAPDIQNRLMFYFTENWQGWQKVILPLHSADGKYIIEGIEIGKWAVGAPALDQVTEIRLRNPKAPPPGSANLKGTWHLDELTLNRSREVSIRVSTLDQAKGTPLSLLIYNGFNYDPIPLSLGQETEVSASSVYSVNGLSLASIYGDRIIGRIKENDDKSLLMSFKIPAINDLDGSPLSLRFQFAIQGQQGTVNTINTGNSLTAIPFTTQISPFSFMEGFQEKAWYIGPDGQAPLLAQGSLNGHDITWLNLHPLLLHEQLAGVDRSEFIDFYKTLMSSLSLDMPLFDPNQEKPLIGHEMFAFTQAKAEGHVIIGAESGFIDFDTMQDIDAMVAGKIVKIPRVSGLRLWGDEGLILKTGEARLSQGKGFYTKIEFTPGIISLSGRDNDIFFTTPEGEKLLTGREISFRLNDPGTALLRKSRLNVEGAALFEDCYTFWGSLYYRIRSEGKNDLLVQGRSELDIIFSDTYTVGNNFKYKGSLERDPPLLAWDETPYLKKYFLPVFLCLITIFILTDVIWRLRKRK